MALAIKRIYNLPPRLSYVSTLLDITEPKTYVVFLSIVPVALKRAGCVSKITVGVRSDIPLPLHMHAAVFATGQSLCR